MTATRDVDVQRIDPGDRAHTCYSAPIAMLGAHAESVVAAAIPWFAVRSVAGAGGLAVGHVRDWRPASVGLRVHARPVVDPAGIDEAVAALRSAGVGLVRFDARELPWVGAAERWLRWTGVRADGDAFTIEDRLAIDDGPHLQSAATARIDEERLRVLLAAGSRPASEAELRREAVFLDDDAVARDAALLWLVPGAAGDTAVGSDDGRVRRDDAGWHEGDAAIELAAAAIAEAAGSEIGYWQEECWQAARYRRLAAASTPGAAPGAALEEAERFSQAAALLLHASIVPAEARRRVKLERAAAAISGLAGRDVRGSA